MAVGDAAAWVEALAVAAGGVAAAVRFGVGHGVVRGVRRGAAGGGIVALGSQGGSSAVRFTCHGCGGDVAFAAAAAASRVPAAVVG